MHRADRAAEKLNEDHLRAQEDLKAKQAELDKANSDVASVRQSEDQAKADEEKFRGHVDELTGASFQGARFTQLSALLVSDSQQDFLNRMSALGVLAADNAESMDKLSDAVARADQTRKGAQDAQGRARRGHEARGRHRAAQVRFGCCSVGGMRDLAVPWSPLTLKGSFSLRSRC